MKCKNILSFDCNILKIINKIKIVLILVIFCTKHYFKLDQNSKLSNRNVILESRLSHANYKKNVQT